MDACQRVAHAEAASHREVLRLAAYLVVGHESGERDAEVLLLEERAAEGDAAHVAGVACVVAVALLVAQGGAHVHFPCMDVHAVGCAEGHRLDVALAGGKAVEVLVFRIAGREAHVVSQLFGVVSV